MTSINDMQIQYPRFTAFDYLVQNNVKLNPNPKVNNVDRFHWSEDIIFSNTGACSEFAVWIMEDLIKRGFDDKVVCMGYENSSHTFSRGHVFTIKVEPRTITVYNYIDAGTYLLRTYKTSNIKAALQAHSEEFLPMLAAHCIPIEIQNGSRGKLRPFVEISSHKRQNLVKSLHGSECTQADVLKILFP